jgi:hypothetical protein
MGSSHQKHSDKRNLGFSLKDPKKEHNFFEKGIFHYTISTHLLHGNGYTRQETNYKFTPCF